MRMEMNKKYTLAMRRNCSQMDFGSQEYQVYLVVLIALALYFLVVPGQEAG